MRSNSEIKTDAHIPLTMSSMLIFAAAIRFCSWSGLRGSSSISRLRLFSKWSSFLAFRNSTFTSVRLLLISWARKMKNLLHLRTDTSYFWVFTSTSLPLFLKSFNRLGFASVGIVIV
jgi:hypothetical protein